MARDEDVVTEAASTPIVETAPVGESEGEALLAKAATLNGEVPAEIKEQVSADIDAEIEKQAAKPAGPSAEEIAKALDEFRVKVIGEEADEESGTAKIDGLIDQKDTSTGVLPEAVVVEIKALYDGLPGASAKSRAREIIQREMNTAVIDRMDVVTARALSLLREALTEKTAAGRATVAKAAADPTETQVANAVRLMLAPNLIQVLSGVKDNWAELATNKARSLESDVKTYREYQAALDAWEANESADKGDAPAEPNVDQLVKDAARIARGRRATSAKKAGTSAPKAPKPAGEGYSGPRRSIAKHIQSYFADKPDGHFARCGEISKHTSEEYPTPGEASQGAISAHLFPASGKERTFDGYEAAVDASGTKGARKL